jgi:hypothetical protein
MRPTLNSSWFILVELLAASSFVGAAIAQPPAEPTEQQIRDAISAVRDLNGVAAEDVDPRTKRKILKVFMPTSTNDATMLKFPPLPIRFDLSLGDTQVTDAGLKKIGQLKNLSGLFLHGTKVTDDGLKDVSSLANLKDLWLDGTEVTDAGLKHLERLSALSHLSLEKTKVTKQGIHSFRKAIPKCEIEQ